MACLKCAQHRPPSALTPPPSTRPCPPRAGFRLLLFGARDGTCLVRGTNTLELLTPSGWLTSISGATTASRDLLTAMASAPFTPARTHERRGQTRVHESGDGRAGGQRRDVVADTENHAIRGSSRPAAAAPCARWPASGRRVSPTGWAPPRASSSRGAWRRTRTGA